MRLRQFTNGLEALSRLPAGVHDAARPHAHTIRETESWTQRCVREKTLYAASGFVLHIESAPAAERFHRAGVELDTRQHRSPYFIDAGSARVSARVIRAGPML